MRLRALVAMAIMLTITPAAPALAADSLPVAPPPAVAPPVTDAAVTVPAATGTAPPAVPETSAQETPPVERPKLEAGLGGDKDEAGGEDGGGRVIVEVAAPAEAAPVAGEARTLPDAEVVLQPPDASFLVVEGTGEALEKLAADPRVVSVRRDRAYSAASLSSGLKLIGADRAVAEGATGEGRTIAVVDTGIDAGHPALGGKVVDEACFSATGDGAKSLCPGGQNTQTGPGAADARTAACVSGTVNLCDHGTHVAGIAHVVAPGADMVAVQVFSRFDGVEECVTENACVGAYESTILLALDHLIKLKDTSRPGLVAVNLSLGGGFYEGACDGAPEIGPLKERIDALRARGVVTVAAAGNEGVTGGGAPACVSSAVTVGAVGDDDRVPSWSNHGPTLDLFAPGLEIDSAVPGGGTAVYSGTSMAAPHVTGALAALAQKSADASPDALLGRLTAAGRPIVYGGVTTPRLDVYGALTGQAPGPPATQEPGDPGDGDGPDDAPVPDPSSGPAPDPRDDAPAPSEPEPVPLPTVTVTVTVTAAPVTVPPPGSPASAPAVCTRGRGTERLTAAQWAVEMTRGKGVLSDGTLGCYLRLVSKASAVFPEAVRASTPGTAYRVLRPAKRTARAALDGELLAAWLNWAHGAAELTAKAGRTGSAEKAGSARAGSAKATVGSVIAAAERRRLAGASLAASTSMLRKEVNVRRTA
ncbi:S8 family serine peptidase [Streptosporangium sp. NPDC048047]|uniref:S8 family peptidase n=1 Tax=Streptosporangium sp. NPDC048047 TaxID=3155748 RepID=UPI00344498D7